MRMMLFLDLEKLPIGCTYYIYMVDDEIKNVRAFPWAAGIELVPVSK
jgi:hypothetical protein